MKPSLMQGETPYNPGHLDYWIFNEVSKKHYFFFVVSLWRQSVLCVRVFVCVFYVCVCVYACVCAV